MPAGVLGNRLLTAVGGTCASRKSLQTSKPIQMRSMAGTPESRERATSTDGFPVRAGECGVKPQLLFEPRIADCEADPTYSRTRKVLADYGLVPQWCRLPQPRIQWVKSG